jgi:hypothetical protein
MIGIMRIFDTQCNRVIHRGNKQGINFLPGLLRGAGYLHKKDEFHRVTTYK